MNGESEGKLVYPGSTYRQSSTEGVVRTKGREGIFKAHRHDQKRVEIEEPVSSCRVTVDWIYFIYLFFGKCFIPSGSYRDN